MNPGLEVEGIVLTMFDARNNLAHQVAEEVKRHFHVFDSVIPRNVRLSEAPSHGKPVHPLRRAVEGGRGVPLARARAAPGSRDDRAPHGPIPNRSDARSAGGSTRSSRLRPSASATTASRSVFSCALEKIVPQKGQPRQHFDAKALDELAESIREHGLLEPIVVRRRRPGVDRFEIIAGERRWRACRRRASARRWSS